MENDIEIEIYKLRSILNKIVTADISLSDDRVVRLSNKLDKLLITYLHAKTN